MKGRYGFGRPTRRGRYKAANVRRSGKRLFGRSRKKLRRR